MKSSDRFDKDRYIGSKSTILNKVLLALEYLNIGFVVYGGDFSTLCSLQLMQFGDVQ